MPPGVAGENVGAGVVDPDVYARDGALQMLDQAANFFLLADVHPQNLSAAPLRSKVPRGSLGPFLILAIGDNQVSSGFGAAKSNRPADPTGPPRDQHVFSLQHGRRLPRNLGR